jgi:putative transcriptional regulator
MTAPTPAGVTNKSVNHRLGDEWLMAYAAGALSEGQSLIVASHLSYLKDAPERISLAEAAGGALLERLEADRMSPDALARTLALLDADAPVTQTAPQPQRPAEAGDPLPAPLRDWLGCNVDDLKWTWLGPGMKKVNLWHGGPNDQRLWMLRAAPGIDIPMHGHSGTELVLVLKGSLTDPHGTFHMGDIEECTSDDIHALRTGEGEECICLALTEGPTRFKGWIARMLQPFTGL